MPLLPPAWRGVGYVLATLGLVLGVARFRYGVTPAILEVRVFALVSSYFETRYLTSFTKNVAAELAALLVLAGLLLAALARERDEHPGLDALRLRAVAVAAVSNAALLAVAFCLVFGVGFVGVLVANLYSGLVLYLLVFRWLRWRAGRSGGLGRKA